MHVLFIDTVHPSLAGELKAMGFQVAEGYGLSKKECSDFFRTKEGGVVIRGKFNLDREWIEAAEGLKFIARFGSGMEHIDTAYAKEKGIACLSSPEGNRDALGDHTLGMLLMLLNHLQTVNEEVRAGIWKREENRGTELNALVVGLIGYGNMGSAFAKRLLGFDCEVLVYDPFIRVENFPSSHYKQVSLEELQKKADIVSFHVPLNESTRSYANKKFLYGFEKNIIVINTSRGPVVETAALLDAMEENKVRGACLDVLDFEEENFETVKSWSEDKNWLRLISKKEIILSPHIAGWSHQSNEKMAVMLSQKINALQLL